MSTKTLRKRIALATTVALGAGVLSLVSVSAANAAVGTDAGIAGTGQTIYANGSTGAGASGASAASVGLLGSSVSNGLLAQTATLLATGKIAVGNYIGTANTDANIKVTGGVIVSAAQGSGATTGSATPTVSGTGLNSATALATSSRSDLTALIAPNGGATSMTISIYDGATTTNPVANIAVTIAASSSYNAFSAAQSTVYWGAGSNSDSATTDASTTYTSATDGNALTGYVTLKDAYGNLLTNTNTSLLTITGSAGTLVGVGGATGVGNVAFSANPVSTSFNVRQATAHTGLAVTLTFAMDGVVFATKTATITGEVAKVTVTPTGVVGAVGANNQTGSSGATASIANVSYYDGAGNSVYPASGLSQVSSTLGAVVSAISQQHYATSGSDTVSPALAITGASKGTATGLKVQFANASGTIVTSNAFNISIGGGPDTYTAKWDQASYTPGEIATLTITVIDSKGNPASAYTALSGLAAGDTPTVANAPGTAVTAPSRADYAQSGLGIIKYKYTVSLADGTYTSVVDVPSLDVDGAAQTATYSIKSNGTTLNDVLAGIVSLIASINKQIAALAKLVAPKAVAKKK
jgi:hypothetical protein